MINNIHKDVIVLWNSSSKEGIILFIFLRGTEKGVNPPFSLNSKKDMYT